MRVGASWSAIARPLRYAAVAVLVLLLVGGWVYLYVQVRAVDLRAANAVLEGLRELKEIDSRWNDRLIAMRLAAEPETARPGPTVDVQRVARVQSQLAVNAFNLGNLIAPQSVAALKTAFDGKARAVEQFITAKTAFSSSLDAFVQAGDQAGGLPPPAARAAERLTAATLTFIAQPSSAAGKIVEAAADTLAGEDVQLGLAPQVQGLATAARAVVQAKIAEDARFRDAFFASTGPRLDTLTREFERQFGNALDDAERYRLYLFIYSALILLLALWLAWRLGHTYKVIASINRQLREANETLEHRVEARTRELAHALSQLKENEVLLIQSEKMSSLGQMVAGVAHEVNTPLAYVKSSLDSVSGHMPRLADTLAQTERLIAMLQSDRTSDQELSVQFAQVSGQLAEIKSRGTLGELGTLVTDGLYGIGQISELVSNLKNFARLDRSKIADFDLNEGVASSLLIAKVQLKDKQVNRELGGIPHVSCSPSQINQVFLNLITNAAQATPAQGGAITVRTRTHGAAHVAVEVEDNGHGIPPEVLPKIFDPFFTTKEAGKGTGLGLAICYKIVQSHGGRIEVASKPGAGTRFTVILPIEPVTVPAEAA